MYCPNCGQQQVSDEMRFCSRCGLALSGLAEWLAGGALPVRRQEDVKSQGLSRQRKGIRRGAKVMFFSVVLLPVFLAISIAVDEGGPMIIPAGIFFIGLMVMAYASIFLDNTAPAIEATAQTSALGSSSTRASLPPPTNMPMPGSGRRHVRTNELAQPPSVTENTTKLLDNE
jgi:hypothetical protein